MPATDTYAFSSKTGKLRAKLDAHPFAERTLHQAVARQPRRL